MTKEQFYIAKKIIYNNALDWEFYTADFEEGDEEIIIELDEKCDNTQYNIEQLGRIALELGNYGLRIREPEDNVFWITEKPIGA